MPQVGTLHQHHARVAAHLIRHLQASHQRPIILCAIPRRKSVRTRVSLGAHVGSYLHLTVANVHSDDALCTALQEAVCEAASGDASIQAAQALDRHPKSIDSGFQLVACSDTV